LRLVKAEGAKSDRISHVHFAQGRSLGPSEFDPMKPYRKDEKKGWLPFPIQQEKVVWRDASALLELTSDPERPVPALNWVARAVADGILPRHTRYNLDTFAVGTQPGKASSISLWRHDRMPLPLSYLDNKNLVQTLKRNAANSLRQGLAAFRLQGWPRCRPPRAPSPRAAGRPRP
jgi:hypothetical protein